MKNREKAPLTYSVWGSRSGRIAWGITFAFMVFATPVMLALAEKEGAEGKGDE